MVGAPPSVLQVYAKAAAATQSTADAILALGCAKLTPVGSCGSVDVVAARALKTSSDPSGAVISMPNWDS